MGISRSVACGLVLSLWASVTNACSIDRVTVFGDFGRANFNVTVADTPETKSKGLMHVEKLAMLEGMLFVYDAPQHATFWMRNTLIPLDMLFASADGTIKRIHANAVPLDETVIDGGQDIQFVLEINGGFASRLGIMEGDILQHPALGDESILPCSEKDAG